MIRIGLVTILAVCLLSFNQDEKAVREHNLTRKPWRLYGIFEIRKADGWILHPENIKPCETDDQLIFGTSNTYKMTKGK